MIIKLAERLIESIENAIPPVIPFKKTAINKVNRTHSNPKTLAFIGLRCIHFSTFPFRNTAFFDVLMSK